MFRLTLACVPLLAVAAVLPARTSAQTPAGLSLEPFVGAYFDNSYGTGTSFSRGGPVFGGRVGVGVFERLMLGAEAAFARVRNVDRFGVTADDYYRVGRDTWTFTGNLSYTVLDRGPRLELGVGAGVIRRRAVKGDSVGTPPPFGPEYQQYASALVVIPEAALLVPFRSGVSATLRLRDVYVPDERTASNSPAIVAGVQFRVR